MGEVTKHEPGAFSWVDVMTTDQDGAKNFYGRLFGWEVDDLDAGEGQTYSLFRLRGKAVAAASTLPQQHAAQGVPPMWNSYVTVGDVEAITKSVEAAGGKILQGPFDVLTAGRMSVVMDPTGGTICLWQPKDMIGAEITAETNTFSWNELMTPDAEAAKSFYSEVFGWTYDAMDTPNGTYWLVKNGDVMNGGIMKPPGEMPSVWTVYFNVDDTDASVAKAQELGGSVVMPADDYPDVGRIAWLKDPQGATFGIIKPVPQPDA